MSEKSPKPEKQARHAMPKAGRYIASLRTVRFWATPVLITLALMCALAGLYLGGILNPATNLRHFPIAVVNQDAGPYGTQIVTGLLASLDKDQFDVREVSEADAKNLLDRAQVYGEMLIPPSFSSRVRDLGESALTANRTEHPTISISTNPRAGTMGAGIAGQTLAQVAATANTKLGQQLSDQVLAQANGAPLAGASLLAVADPITIESAPYNPLPDGTGKGLSAFYYALLLLLAGFTGSVVVSTLVDAMLGYVPSEFGPVYRLAEQVNISRFRTLLVKWAIMAILALLTSGAYLGIADKLGMPIPLGPQLWLYGVLAITAVGVTSSSLIAALGSVGLMVSMLVFVFLGLPSAGATVPLEAVPPFFHWLSTFEPMHQVFLGVRSLLYLDGHADAGLSHALWMTGLGLAIGLAFGAVVTRFYDRKSLYRVPGAVAHAITAEHQARHQAQEKTRTDANVEANTEPSAAADSSGNIADDTAGNTPGDAPDYTTSARRSATAPETSSEET
ncbi:YhgE/Pip domain-containing protein [Mycobacterium sp.]|uniref:YhgE/Pip domain-containing protein n=1 Tax=Mycobacterium sp. TaxID=1785 RepID=UPI003A878633